MTQNYSLYTFRISKDKLKSRTAKVKTNPEGITHAEFDLHGPGIVGFEPEIVLEHKYYHKKIHGHYFRMQTHDMKTPQGTATLLLGHVSDEATGKHMERELFTGVEESFKLVDLNLADIKKAALMEIVGMPLHFGTGHPAHPGSFEIDVSKSTGKLTVEPWKNIALKLFFAPGEESGKKFIQFVALPPPEIMEEMGLYWIRGSLFCVEAKGKKLLLLTGHDWTYYKYKPYGPPGHPECTISFDGWSTIP